MKLKDILEGICVRNDGESDEDYLTRCGNALTREPDMYNDRETSNIKLQKLMAKKKLPKDMKWNQGFELEEEMPGGAFVGLTSSQGYINGSPSVKKKKQKKEDIVNDNEVDRNDMLLQKFLKKIIQSKNKANVLEGEVMHCNKCGWEWKKEDGGKDMNTCHKCGNTQAVVKEKKHPNSPAYKGKKGYDDSCDCYIDESDINKPSPKLRPEPHPTRHETEHPPYEKDAMKPKGKYTPPSLKEETKEELEKQRTKLYSKAMGMFANSPKQHAVRKEIDVINQKLKAFHKKK